MIKFFESEIKAIKSLDGQCEFISEKIAKIKCPDYELTIKKIIGGYELSLFDERYHDGYLTTYKDKKDICAAVKHMVAFWEKCSKEIHGKYFL